MSELVHETARAVRKSEILWQRAAAMMAEDAPQESLADAGVDKRLHREGYPGTGLGLATCKRIIERYGGRVTNSFSPES